MTRECQVRICERLGVRLPGPTRRELFWDFLKNFSLASGFLLITVGLDGLDWYAFVSNPLASSHPYALRASHNCGTKCHVPALEEGVEPAETPGDGFRAGWLVAA